MFCVGLRIAKVTMSDGCRSPNTEFFVCCSDSQFVYIAKHVFLKTMLSLKRNHYYTSPRPATIEKHTKQNIESSESVLKQRVVNFEHPSGRI